MLDTAFGVEGRQDLLNKAGISELPDGSQMIPEGDAARLHQVLRAVAPRDAPALAAEAGRRTADYILQHRIPKPAQWLLQALPAGLAAPMLARAITAHAWTFAGTGTFRAVTSWVFEIEANPLIRGERSPVPLCHWHAAVFEQLYRVLVHPACRCEEVHCAAQEPGSPCRFEITRWRRRRGFRARLTRQPGTQ